MIKVGKLLVEEKHRVENFAECSEFQLEKFVYFLNICPHFDSWFRYPLYCDRKNKSGPLLFRFLLLKNHHGRIE